MTILLTGLPCSGKTTIALALAQLIRVSGYNSEILDGDIIRYELWKELGFTKADREENIKRLGYLARVLSRNGTIAIIAAVSPYRASRDALRQASSGFIEVYVNAPLSVCEIRDVKGMYAASHHKIHKGKHPHFTGIDDPYEPPLQPDVECHTDEETVAESVAKIIAELKKQETI